MVAGGAAPSPFCATFRSGALPASRRSSKNRLLAHYFDKNPGERFVSDGDANA